MRKSIVVVICIVLLMSGIALAQSILIATNNRPTLQDPKLFLSLGDFLMKNNYQQEAVSMYNRALELDPDNTVVLNNLGFFYKESDPLHAESFFLKAVKLDPEYDTARSNLAILYMQLSMFKEAKTQFAKLAEKHPDNIHYNYDLAICLSKSFYYGDRSYSDLVSAIDQFKRVYAIDPNFEHVIENIRVLDEIKREIDNQR